MSSMRKGLISGAIGVVFTTHSFSLPTTTYTVDVSTDNATTSGGFGSSSTTGDLRYVMNQILNQQASETNTTTYTINFAVSPVNLGAILPPVNLFNADNITIGNNSNSPTTINANGYRPFFICQGDVTLQNMNIENGIAQGGAGGAGGGGGGMGAGGAIFIDQAKVTVSNISFSSNSANAGLGGVSSDASGGGGGLGGNGGTAIGANSLGGGGGYSGNGGSDSDGDSGGGGSIGDGGIDNGGGGGAIIGATGGAGGDPGDAVISPYIYVFGGGGGSGAAGGGTSGGAPNAGDAGGGGGLIGSDGSPSSGGMGGTGGGGGGALDAIGGTGGPGGGGGGSFNNFGGPGGYLGGGGGGITAGGSGGFGGGGGGGTGPGSGGASDFGGGGGGGQGFGEGGGAGGFGGGGGGGGAGGFGGTGGPGASDGTTTFIGGDGAAFGGAIFLNNGGTLTFIGNCSTANNTVSANGGEGAAFGTDLFVISGAELIFAPGNGNTISLTGSISDSSEQSIPAGFTWNPGTSTTGSGTLTMQGPGVLSLTGDNSGFTGKTVVNDGTLALNNKIGGNVIVNSGGKISGNGNVFGNLLVNGTLAPGNSIGTMLANSATLTSSSIFEVEINSAGASDLLAVTTTAEVGGTLRVIPLPGIYTDPQTYTIITTGASGRSGQFSAIDVDPLTLISIVYDPADVEITVLPLSESGFSRNAFAAASCYLSTPYVIGSDVATISSSLLSLDFAGIDAAFNQMQPSQFSALTWTQINNALLIRSSYSRHLEDVLYNHCCPPLFDVWTDGVGQWQHQDTKRYQFGYNDSTGGITLGADVCCDHFRLGLAGTYTHSQLKWKNSGGHAHVNSYYGGLYGSWTDECGYINASILGAYSRYNTSRHLHFADINRYARASHNGWEMLAGLESGIIWHNLCACDLIPFARVDYVYLSQQGYSEDGAESLNLDVRKRQDQLCQSELGMVFTSRYACECLYESWTLVPRLKVSYINQTPLTRHSYHANFMDSSCEFDVRGWNFTRNLGAISLEVTCLSACDILGITVSYDGQYGKHYWNQAGNILLDFKF